MTGERRCGLASKESMHNPCRVRKSGRIRSIEYIVSEVTMSSNGGEVDNETDAGVGLACEAMALSFPQVHFSGGTVQSNSRVSIKPEPAGSAAEFWSIFLSSTASTGCTSVAITSQPRDANVSLGQILELSEFRRDQHTLSDQYQTRLQSLWVETQQKYVE